MTDRPDFTVKIHQNAFLPIGETQVHAIARIEAAGGVPAPRPPADHRPDRIERLDRPDRLERPGPHDRPGGLDRAGWPDESKSPAEVIIIDTSGSMVGERLVAAKRAAKAAVDGLREDAFFGVVAGSHRASMVFPRDPLLARATTDRKSLAKSAISKLTAAGGTRLGRWLTQANTLFAGHEHGVRHAILLTDGKNQHERRAELDAALAACAGRFVCDCRGIGTDWDVPELRRVADALMGSVRRIADPRDLPADFSAMVEAVMGPALADVTLRVWTPHRARLRLVKQVYPAIRDLTDSRVEVGRIGDADSAPGGSDESGPAVGDYPTGIWGPERRDYHLCVAVPAGLPNEAILAARVSLELPGTGGSPAVTLAMGEVRAEWTDDEALSTEMHPWVAHYSRQEELADSVRQALAASHTGDPETARRLYGEAVGMAEALGYEEMTYRLGHVVDIDPATGVVRHKKNIDRGSEMDLDVGSGYTIPPRLDRRDVDGPVGGEN